MLVVKQVIINNMNVYTGVCIYIYMTYIYRERESLEFRDLNT